MTVAVHLGAQTEGEGPLADSEVKPLYRALWDRQCQALRRATPEAAAAGAAARQAAADALEDLPTQPGWVRGGALAPHQLAAVNWLRRRYASGLRSAMLADEMGLGMTASAIAFLCSLWCAHKQTRRTSFYNLVFPRGRWALSCSGS